MMAGDRPQGTQRMPTGQEIFFPNITQKGMPVSMRLLNPNIPIEPGICFPFGIQQLRPETRRA
jgi:hypothetical protein